MACKELTFSISSWKGGDYQRAYYCCQKGYQQEASQFQHEDVAGKNSPHKVLIALVPGLQKISVKHLHSELALFREKGVRVPRKH